MSFGKTVNLGNSIIGVSILAMPYCFVQSGLILSILLIVLSGFLTRLSCHFLLKSAFISRRRSFELMVHDVLGSAGRFMVEIGLIGFLLGTCVAYFIMIGDLAPKIVSELFDLKYSHHLRIISILFLSLFVALPLSLLRKVDSLTSFSLLSMVLYSCLILKLMFETTDKIMLINPIRSGLDKVSYWNLSGLLTTFPIFSMAMSCQTSLFEIFDSSVINNDLDTIKRDNSIIKKAIYMCSFVYITVGLLGYMAFHEQTLYGNILLAFPPSLTTTLTKVGFIITLLMSFPLCLFPCRTSFHSLTVGKMRKSANFQSIPTSAPETTLVGMGENDNNYVKTAKVETGCDNDRNNNNNNNTDNINNNIASINYSNGANHLNTPKTTNRSSTNHSKPYYINNSSYTSLLNDDDISLDELDVQASNNNFSTIQNNSTTQQLPSRLYISDFQFRLLTVILILVTVVLSLMFPHIEFILGIIGSTAGTTVCFILPAYTFIKIGEHSKTELILARMLLIIGLAMLIFCTYSTIHNASLSVPIE